ncbi:hypothetical protein QTP88_014718 [Uroleucon formosanum]
MGRIFSDLLNCPEPVNPFPFDNWATKDNVIWQLFMEYKIIQMSASALLGGTYSGVKFGSTANCPRTQSANTWRCVWSFTLSACVSWILYGCRPSLDAKFAKLKSQKDQVLVNDEKLTVLDKALMTFSIYPIKVRASLLKNPLLSTVWHSSRKRTNGRTRCYEVNRTGRSVPVWKVLAMYRKR